MRKGIPVSPGVAIAQVYCLDKALARQQPKKLDAAAASTEVARLDSACVAARQELDDLIAQVGQQVGETEAAIFRAHRLLLDDPALLTKIQSAILDRQLDARMPCKKSWTNIRPSLGRSRTTISRSVWQTSATSSGVFRCSLPSRRAGRVWPSRSRLS